MAIESGGQLIGILIGGFVGYIIASAIAGGGYRYIGGNLFEITKEPMSYLPGCLFEIVLVAIGAGVGYYIGSMW
jgi:hypothetical protein